MIGNWPVSADRIAADIDALAERTEPGRPWTRRAFTPRFLDGRAYLIDRMQAAGLETRIDTAGNLFGRRAGKVPGRGAILLGSHSDTVPDGGRFDGIAGVVAALEVARALDEAGIALDHDLEVVDFLAEEVSIFGVSCIGSRSVSGLFDESWLTRSADGLTLAEGIRAAGGDPERMAEARRTDIRAMLELHIEQGPVLEQAGEDIGVVTAIVGITRLEITVTGSPDHAGTTPMHARHDALVAGAELVTLVKRLADKLAQEPGHFTATVGEFRMTPNAANVVPGAVTLLIDARAEFRPVMERFLAEIDAGTAEIAARCGVEIPVPRRVSDQSAVFCDAGLRSVLAEAATALGLPQRDLASGAGHDAAWIARKAPAAMIFIPCRGGRSHAPEEWTETEAIAKGAAVLRAAVLKLDAEPQPTETP
jgi:N-carbamoyl-L-amino-acid hydrolase